ncbi:hypothetical protein U9M48_043094 [Paspalum notatum var. saurae]|uniref:Uncharacterized protein n=1 Tax=Paspalum notatum var. saurae TaxID=547442 RepID=A0AAQ3UU72_PASNO
MDQALADPARAPPHLDRNAAPFKRSCTPHNHHERRSRRARASAASDCLCPDRRASRTRCVSLHLPSHFSAIAIAPSSLSTRDTDHRPGIPSPHRGDPPPGRPHATRPPPPESPSSRASRAPLTALDPPPHGWIHLAPPRPRREFPLRFTATAPLVHITPSDKTEGEEFPVGRNVFPEPLGSKSPPPRTDACDETPTAARGSPPSRDT